MNKYVKWALVAGGALLLVKTVKGGGLGPLLPGVGSPADAPGVLTGDVTYKRYRGFWDTARRQNREKFSCAGTIRQTDAAGSFHWGYFWLTSNGAFDHKVRRAD